MKTVINGYLTCCQLLLEGPDGCSMIQVKKSNKVESGLLEGFFFGEKNEEHFTYVRAILVQRSHANPLCIIPILVCATEVTLDDMQICEAFLIFSPYKNPSRSPDSTSLELFEGFQF